jgi:hypothetical protein
LLQQDVAADFFVLEYYRSETYFHRHSEISFCHCSHDDVRARKLAASIHVRFTPDCVAKLGCIAGEVEPLVFAVAVIALCR